MPTFNRRRFVEQALRKVARQDYRQLELVVVDDGSEPIEDLLAGLGWARVRPR
ncbi:glycosyltransferase [Kitasatospora aburaviensis]